MKKLDESKIIKLFQQKIGNKKFVSEDVEIFKIGKTNVVAKIDTFVESTDFPPKMNWNDAARKSIVACISDFTAKGVRPDYGIISINLSRTISDKKIIDIGKGLKKASKEFKFTILGGDTNEGKEVVIQVCIFGTADKITKRSGAKNNHLIFVTDYFGYTSAGLDILLKKKSAQTSFAKKALKHFFQPKPKLDFGIKCKKYFSSAMDSSDGLSITLNEMAKQSNSKFVVDNIPAQKDLVEYAKKNKTKLEKLVFHGGEEYEIVFTIPKKNEYIVKQIAKSLHIPIIEIGYVTKGKGVFLKNNKKITKIKDLGWQHFRTNA